MQVKIAIEPLNEKLPPSEHKSVQIETHTRRGDAFNIQKVDSVLCDGKEVTFNLPDGARLLISTPQATEELVYDKAQGAAIRASAQLNKGGERADIAGVDKQLNAPPQDNNKPAAPSTPPQQRTGTQGLDTRTPAEKQAQGGQPTQITPPGQGQSAQGQSAPNPPGTTPATPAGSPPAGEGKK